MYNYLPGTVGESAPIKMWTKGVQVEEAALQQLVNISKMPFIFDHVAAMPDVHWGTGATVGSVIATKGAVIPAAVGVDIGCGMCAVLTSLTANDLPDSLLAMRSAIEAAVPHGRTNDGRPGDRGAWGNPPPLVESSWCNIRDGLALITDKHPKLFKHSPEQQTVKQLGSLGTGNHFVEVCLDEQQRVWVMLHSGSRGVGNRIGTYFIELAKQDMRKWFINLPDDDLAYLPEGTSYFDDYFEAVHWAQNFAAVNRNIMLTHALDAMRATLGCAFEARTTAINCHHNYMAVEHHFGTNVIVTRKGAVRARLGDWGIIPGSMGVCSYIVQGKGNEDSFTSCSHGAGRAMSRGAARKRFTLADHAAATAGVECRKDDGVLDETPGAYKPIDAVMAAQDDLVSVVHTLKQVLCVKG